ncbi:tyrosine-type recombinase/integrase [Sphaerotilus sp.]|uniref:tyrosine-type recombinase/integrase n=1 Tax=Sphaerotilus sp. TaxID=2093942 RepID=UPI0034E2D73E
MANETLPLFFSSDGDALAEVLNLQFSTWLASSPARGLRQQGALREESAQIYADMWQAFIAYCAPFDEGTGTRSVCLDPRDALTREDLVQFLAFAAIRPQRQSRTGRLHAELTPRYAWRLLQLIDRVLNHGRETLGLEPVEAPLQLMQEAPYRYANASALTPVPDVLTEAQASALIAHCTAVSKVSEGLGTQWKAIRDRTAVALMLGAGLAPGQVRVLTLDDVAVDGGAEPGVPWRLSVAADGSSAAHQVPIALWAARELRFWLDVRARQGMLQSPWVFPSTTTGKAWSHPACHRAAVAVMEEAGVEGGSPFRLRHTFAVRQLLNGHAEEEVARWMGYADTGPMKRYRHVLAAPAAGIV